MDTIKVGKPFPLGVSETAEGTQFAVYKPYGETCILKLYEKGKEKESFSLHKIHGVGIFSICFTNRRMETFHGMEYVYIIDGVTVVDPYARGIKGREKWGIRRKTGVDMLRGIIPCEAFDWEEDEKPDIPYENLVLYQLHVRGFTKHPSSKVKERGTFLGVQEKIPYLKELGINGVFLLPCYDFDEIMEDDVSEITKRYLESYQYETPLNENSPSKEVSGSPSKINYWGYTKRAAYFAPKASYALDSANPQKEMKEMIKAFHKEGLEVIMDMFFDTGTNPNMVLDCLRYWVMEYHIDGFRVNDNVVPAKIAAKDPVIAGVKLLASSWREEEAVGVHEKRFQKRLGEYNEGFQTVARRYLKSDEGQIGDYMFRTKRNPKGFGVINYLTSVNGFTMMDLVSYDVKHNARNGEQGRDGADYNYSWNCGVEGRTRKKSILSLRKQQMRNGFLMMFLSQGTPMILGGDEFGNSQDGNNNAYCQDNQTGWLDWDRLSVHQDLYDFVKDLLAFRKEHPIFHNREELKGTDYISSGSPDISFHGTRAWYVDNSYYSRMLGVMLNGTYVRKNKLEKDGIFYIAYNMHWEPHSFDLPKLSDGMKWYIAVDTSLSRMEKREITDQKSCVISARTIVVFAGMEIKESEKAENE